MATPNRTYMSNGQVLETPPLTVRLSQQFDNVYNFFGLYFVSLLSLDPYAAAESSQFNTRGRPNSSQNRPRWSSGTNSRGPAGSGSSPRGPGSGGGGRPGGAPRRTMGIDDVRAPECGSCGNVKGKISDHICLTSNGHNTQLSLTHTPLLFHRSNPTSVITIRLQNRYKLRSALQIIVTIQIIGVVLR
ncbi:hypothetical protein GJ744_008632 [Endocarpon pusillum]|uniref:Uncharacterized protein n=1 Tax=Endocarpon pusillum TaxID=364733 RepID=A0A8H7AGY0_9EURO|nr:hypothetical protein GJ744_008632 [Endocarpon pusillum]